MTGADDLAAARKRRRVRVFSGARGTSDAGFSQPFLFSSKETDETI